jgi:hypothetical protein
MVLAWTAARSPSLATDQVLPHQKSEITQTWKMLKKMAKFMTFEIMLIKGSL